MEFIAAELTKKKMDTNCQIALESSNIDIIIKQIAIKLTPNEQIKQINK